MFLFCLVLLCFCARLFICALWSPAWKGLTSWLSFVVSNCEFVTFPLVSCDRCGTRLYRFLIFAPLLTLLYIWYYRDLSVLTCEKSVWVLYNRRNSVIHNFVKSTLVSLSGINPFFF